jgi:hypothetical protein
LQLVEDRLRQLSKGGFEVAHDIRAKGPVKGGKVKGKRFWLRWALGRDLRFFAVICVEVFGTRRLDL